MTVFLCKIEILFTQGIVIFLYIIFLSSFYMCNMHFAIRQGLVLSLSFRCLLEWYFTIVPKFLIRPLHFPSCSYCLIHANENLLWLDVNINVKQILLSVYDNLCVYWTKAMMGNDNFIIHLLQIFQVKEFRKSVSIGQSSGLTLTIALTLVQQTHYGQFQFFSANLYIKKGRIHELV